VIVQDLSQQHIAKLLTSTGFTFKAGQFNIKLFSNIPQLSIGIKTLYGKAIIPNDACDFSIQLKTPSSIRRFIKPQVVFSFNGIEPFTPLPKNQALPLLEWGLNWCVTNHCHTYLVVHAAVVEKNGCALILPGNPGAGKSTLCTALVEIGGWRLLSDELTMLDLKSGTIQPNPRPISLKNKAIELAKSFADKARFSPTVHDTIKGSVAHLSPLNSSIASVNVPAQPKFIIYPQYLHGSENSLTPISKGTSFVQMAENSFNYSVLGLEGFNALGKLHDSVECFRFRYDGDLAFAVKTMDALVA